MSYITGTDCNGARQTKVVNKQGEFLPPRPLLSAYLEQRSWEEYCVPALPPKLASMNVEAALNKQTVWIPDLYWLQTKGFVLENVSLCCLIGSCTSYLDFN